MVFVLILQQPSTSTVLQVIHHQGICERALTALLICCTTSAGPPGTQIDHPSEAPDSAPTARRDVILKESWGSTDLPYRAPMYPYLRPPIPDGGDGPS